MQANPDKFQAVAVGKETFENHLYLILDMQIFPVMMLNIKINVREYRRGNQNGRSMKTGNIAKKNKTKTQHNMCWTPLTQTIMD
jgi:hypothetical protein